MSRPDLGRMRHRVAIEEQVRVPDGGGGALVAWIESAEVWAAVVPVSGTEGPGAGAIAARVTHEIWMRAGADVRPDMRLRQGARIFKIGSVIDDAGEGRFLRILCEEQLP